MRNVHAGCAADKKPTAQGQGNAFVSVIVAAVAVPARRRYTAECGMRLLDYASPVSVCDRERTGWRSEAVRLRQKADQLGQHVSSVAAGARYGGEGRFGEHALALEPRVVNMASRYPSRTFHGGGVGPARQSLRRPLAWRVSPTIWKRRSDICKQRSTVSERARRTPRIGHGAQQSRHSLLAPHSRGERADNEETAIAHCEAAENGVFARGGPELWGQLQNNLAIVYWSRDQGRPRQATWKRRSGASRRRWYRHHAGKGS